MSKEQEILQLFQALSESKQAEVIDFARFLLARQDDEAWERILAETRRRPKLEAFARESAAEGERPMGDGSHQAFGGWAGEDAELDAFLAQVRRDRKSDQNSV